MSKWWVGPVLTTCAAAAFIGAWVEFNQTGVVDAVEQRLGRWAPGSNLGCSKDAGSSKPYPESGPIELTAKEKGLSEGYAGFVASSAKDGAGAATLANQDDTPASALFIDEDGIPAAKAFARGGSWSTISLKAGAYDVWIQSGTDWRGDGFGACAKSLKAKGIVVIEPGKGSHVVLYGELAFVLANRMDPEVSKRLVEDEKRRFQSKQDGPQPPERPEREDRPI